VNGSRKISRQTFGRCPKITAKHKCVLKTKYPSQLMTRVPREITRKAIATDGTRFRVQVKKPQTKQNSGPEICLEILDLNNTEREHTVGLLAAAPVPCTNCRKIKQS
jgi:hypothetical protein